MSLTIAVYSPAFKRSQSLHLQPFYYFGIQLEMSPKNLDDLSNLSETFWLKSSLTQADSSIWLKKLAGLVVNESEYLTRVKAWLESTQYDSQL